MEDVDEEEASGEVARDEATGLDSAVISLGGGVTKRVTLNTHAVQQKTQVPRPHTHAHTQVHHYILIFWKRYV